MERGGQRAAVLKALEERVDPEVYRAWSAHLRFDFTDESTCRVLVPNPFVKSWVERAFGPALPEALSYAGLSIRKIEYAIERSAEVPPTTHSKESRSKSSGSASERSDPLVLTRTEKPRSQFRPSQVLKLPTDEVVRDIEEPARVSDVGDGARGVDDLVRMAATGEESKHDHEFYSEMCLIRYPFASLNTKDTGSVRVLKVLREIRAGQTKSDFEWIVTPGKPFRDDEGFIRCGLCGPTERRVFRAIEKIVHSRTLRKGVPITNPQPIEVTEILDTLRLNPRMAGNFKTVRRALERLKATTIFATGELEPGFVTPPRGLMFSPLSEVHWRGEKNRDGVLVKQTQLFFPDVYINRVLEGRVRPIDWDYWLALELPGAQRLYELLEPRFFGLRNSPYVHYRYKELCLLLPCEYDEDPRRRKRAFFRYHQRLTAALKLTHPDGRERLRLLDHVEWKSDGDDADIYYFPDAEYLARLRERKQPPAFDTRAIQLAQELRDMNSLRFYQKVLGSVDWQYVQAARSEVRMAIQSKRRLENPASFFTTTLKNILTKAGTTIPF